MPGDKPCSACNNRKFVLDDERKQCRLDAQLRQETALYAIRFLFVMESIKSSDINVINLMYVESRSPVNMCSHTYLNVYITQSIRREDLYQITTFI